MGRDDLPALRALEFPDSELKELGLWAPATGEPGELAEMYVRRSKSKDTKSSLREQVRRMCDHARREGKQIRHVWFEQKSASKAHVRREEFESATAAIVAGLSKTLYVFKTSRLSRRGMGQVGLLLDKFEECQARIYVVAEGIDSAGSRMVLAILSEQAREQAADIATFTKLGIDSNKADGRFTGGVTPYGLRAVAGKLEHNPAEYATARRIADWLLERRTPAWIADTLNGEGVKPRHARTWKGPGIVALAHSVTWAAWLPTGKRCATRTAKTAANITVAAVRCSIGKGTRSQWDRVSSPLPSTSKSPLFSPPVLSLAPALVTGRGASGKPWHCSAAFFAADTNPAADPWQTAG